MGKILVVDGEDKAREEITKALLSLNPQNKLEVFAKFEDLETHVKNLNDEEQKTFYDFDLVVLDYALVNPAEWEAKLKDLKSRQEKQASYCFTAYDDVHVNRKHITQLHARNIFYKPFDPLILKESLNIALKFKS
jgi:response regulator RpfG family c-di-GMP phosphodiesterase